MTEANDPRDAAKASARVITETVAEITEALVNEDYEGLDSTLGDATRRCSHGRQHSLDHLASAQPWQNLTVRAEIGFCAQVARQARTPGGSRWECWTNAPRSRRDGTGERQAALVLDQWG